MTKTNKKHPINLIGISGKIGSGKDTVGKILQYLDYLKFKDLNERQTCEYFLKNNHIEGFGDSEWLNNQSYQIKKYADKTTKAFELITGINYHKLSREDKEKIRPQYVEFAEKQKEIFGEDVWVNALFADYKPLTDITTSNIYKDNRLQHGYKNTKIWRAYHNIKQRCNNPKHPRYNDYGGRGIKMCDEWSNSIESFISWAKSKGYNDNLTIDRINNDGIYSPNNCRVVTYSVQSINTKTRKDNSSGYRGVSKDKHGWRASIQINKKRKFLGYFDTAEQASEAYEEAYLERENLYIKENETNIVYPSWLVTDVRFHNEAKAIKDRGGIVIRVNRLKIDDIVYWDDPEGFSSGVYKIRSINNEEAWIIHQDCMAEAQVLPSELSLFKDPQHASETALDDYKFDYVIDNNSDIPSLVEKVKQLNLV